MKKVIRKRIYNVNWVRNGFCYHTTTECTMEDIKDMKKVAKALGEKIEYEFDHFQEYTYILK